MTLWIPGANGLLGSCLKSVAKNALCTGSEVDIGNQEAVFAFAARHPSIRSIVNCAAFSLVDLAEERQDEAFAANVIGPENLAKLARDCTHHFIGANLHGAWQATQ